MRRHTDVLALVLIVMLIGGANLLWTSHAVNSTQAAQQRAALQQQAAERRAGQVVERKLCATLGKLAALQPPAGNAGANPSRAYEQELHETLSQLGADVGCRP